MDKSTNARKRALPMGRNTNARKRALIEQITSGSAYAQDSKLVRDVSEKLMRLPFVTLSQLNVLVVHARQNAFNDGQDEAYADVEARGPGTDDE